MPRPPPEMPAAAPAPISAEPCEAPEAVLKRVFGYETFREGQKETIDAILAGRDVLAVMPTGSGQVHLLSGAGRCPCRDARW